MKKEIILLKKLQQLNDLDKLYSVFISTDHFKTYSLLSTMKPNCIKAIIMNEIPNNVFSIEDRDDKNIIIKPVNPNLIEFISYLAILDRSQLFHKPHIIYIPQYNEIIAFTKYEINNNLIYIKEYLRGAFFTNKKDTIIQNTICYIGSMQKINIETKRNIVSIKIVENKEGISNDYLSSIPEIIIDFSNLIFDISLPNIIKIIRDDIKIQVLIFDCDIDCISAAGICDAVSKIRPTGLKLTKYKIEYKINDNDWIETDSAIIDINIPNSCILKLRKFDSFSLLYSNVLSFNIPSIKSEMIYHNINTLKIPIVIS